MEDMTKPRNAATKPRGKLPPVEVICTSQACGYCWLSGAARHSVIRCPECGHSNRVKRDPPAGRPRHIARTQSRPRKARKAPNLYAGHAAPVLSPMLIPAPRGAQTAAVDDDGWTWVYLTMADGRVVLADWTAHWDEGGILVPVTLVDQRFRLLAAGYCTVYGCRGPARRTWDRWPVCDECRIWLGPEPPAVRALTSTHF
jgi:hypothetical protein